MPKYLENEFSLHYADYLGNERSTRGFDFVRNLLFKCELDFINVWDKRSALTYRFLVDYLGDVLGFLSVLVHVLLCTGAGASCLPRQRFFPDSVSFVASIKDCSSWTRVSIPQ